MAPRARRAAGVPPAARGRPGTRRADIRPVAPGDQAASAARAIESFLDAVVPPAARRAPDLAGTPARVAEAWLAGFVDGYGQDPGDVLAEAMPTTGHDLVAVTGIDFHSMCPHHLLPSRGVAHVAYVPGGRVVGFGALARLVDCFAHRLLLQEELARQVAESLMAPPRRAGRGLRARRRAGLPLHPR